MTEEKKEGREEFARVERKLDGSGRYCYSLFIGGKYVTLISPVGREAIHRDINEAHQKSVAQAVEGERAKIEQAIKDARAWLDEGINWARGGQQQNAYNCIRRADDVLYPLLRRTPDA